jgi:hypothetical protein
VSLVPYRIDQNSHSIHYFFFQYWRMHSGYSTIWATSPALLLSVYFSVTVSIALPGLAQTSRFSIKKGLVWFLLILIIEKQNQSKLLSKSQVFPGSELHCHSRHLHGFSDKKTPDSAIFLPFRCEEALACPGESCFMVHLFTYILGAPTMCWTLYQTPL